MNLAFSALVLIALAAPGFVAWYAYRTEERSYVGLHSRPPLDQVLLALIVSVLLHLPCVIFCCVISRWSGVTVDLDSVVRLLAGVSRKAEVESITKYPFWILLYFLAILMLACLFGWLLRTVVRKYRLDRRIPILRFNDWYYLLMGDRDLYTCPGFDRGGVYLAAVVEIGGDNYLYRGFVHDFFLDRQGDLNRLVLVAASRRKLTDDRKKDEEHTVDEDPRYYSIYGQHFVLKYSSVKNLQLTYVSLREKVSSSQQGLEESPQSQADLPPENGKKESSHTNKED